MHIIEHEVPMRGPGDLRLDQATADAMIAKGFRFAIYDKRLGRFELEPVYEIGRDALRPVWLWRQIIADPQ